MKISLDLMVKLMRRVGNNPFASPKPRARSLLLRLQEEGFEVVQAEPTPQVSSPEPEALELPPLNRQQMARMLYNEKLWPQLFEHKRAAKVSWERLGFTLNEEMDILLKKPTN